MRIPVSRLRALDEDSVRWCARRRSAPLDAAAKTISRGGVAGLPWVVVGALMARRAASPALAARNALAVWSAFAASTGVARLVRRRRPCARWTRVALLDYPDSPSFPSDQAAAAFAGAVTLSLAAGKLRPPLLLAATVNALARVYAGLHYPSDAVAGALLGAACGRVAARF